MRGLLGSTRAWFVIGILGAVAVIGLGWALLISPQRSALDELQTETVRQEGSNMAARATIERLKKESEQLPARKAELAAMKVTIPPVAGMPELLRSLNAVAKATGATLGELTPGPAVPIDAVRTTGKNAQAALPAEGLQKIPVTLRITGTYQQTEKFVAEAQKLPRGLLITELSFDAGTATALDPFDTTIVADVFINPELGAKAKPTSTAKASPSPSAGAAE